MHHNVHSNCTPAGQRSRFQRPRPVLKLNYTESTTGSTCTWYRRITNTSKRHLFSFWHTKAQFELSRDMQCPAPRFLTDALAFALQENDEDIGALGSILSWDDEDEAAASSAEALDESNKISSLAAQPPTFASYPQQISIIAMQGTTQAIQAQIAQQPYQMMMQNVQAYQTQQQAFRHQNGQILCQTCMWCRLSYVSSLP